MRKSEFTGPAWDNSDEYSSINDDAIAQDLKKGRDLILLIQEHGHRISKYAGKAAKLTPPEMEDVVPILQEVSNLSEEATRLFGNIQTYLTCTQSVNSGDETAKSLIGVLRKDIATLAAAYKPMELLLIMAAPELIKKYLKGEKTQHEQFYVANIRKTRDERLSLPEEDLIIRLGVDGFTAWSTLYDNLSGVVRCPIKILGEPVKEVGLTQAIAYLDNSDRSLRSAAHNAINAGWSVHQESCAAILNSLTGTRLEIGRRRSHTKPVHYLDSSLLQNRITRATLDTIMSCVAENKSLGRRTLKAQAQALGLDALGPCDRFAPPPVCKGHTEQHFTFAAACDLIRDAFSEVNPEMGEFVTMMIKNKWIDGAEGANRRPGAYCTKFPKSRHPRVFLTYSGGMKDVMTLAHELGHAFHNWLLRDLPSAQISYPMTLAETASIFAETVVNDSLIKKAKSPAEIFTVQWDGCRDAESFLLNVASRFTFESELNERRKSEVLSSAGLSQLMEKHWREWYGSSLEEMDSLFWCTKLHFHLSRLSFYNYPYIFGYLFSLGVYAQKEKLGTDFFSAYTRLLRDTGRLTAEEVAMNHLDVDLTKPEFWRDSLGIVELKVRSFEKSVESLFGQR
jgi:oligoendopeptidase F